MSRKKILFISGSFGLGHVTRDLPIAEELRRQVPDVDLEWIATGPAAAMLFEAGEKLVPVARQWVDYTPIALVVLKEWIRDGKPYYANIIEVLLGVREAGKRNVSSFVQFINNNSYDLVVGDEAFELEYALRDGRIKLNTTYVMIMDFLGYHPMTWRPKVQMLTYMMNRKWVRDFERIPSSEITCLFVGELDDVLEKRFGFLLPNLRDHARKRIDFLGHVLRFNPANYQDQDEVRAKLGYGPEKLVVCSVGGTPAGRPLLELCSRAFPVIRARIPDLRMVLVCGPGLAAEGLTVSPGLDVHGYVPDLFEHFAASDLAIVMGGGTTTTELTALRKPFLYFPMEGHFEQSIHIAYRLDRIQAGVRMWFSKTTPESLADAVIANLSKKVHYKSIRTDGAQRAAKLIYQLLEKI